MRSRPPCFPSSSPFRSSRPSPRVSGLALLRRKSRLPRRSDRRPLPEHRQPASERTRRFAEQSARADSRHRAESPLSLHELRHARPKRTAPAPGVPLGQDSHPHFSRYHHAFSPPFPERSVSCGTAPRRPLLRRRRTDGLRVEITSPGARVAPPARTGRPCFPADRARERASSGTRVPGSVGFRLVA